MPTTTASKRCWLVKATLLLSLYLFNQRALCDVIGTDMATSSQEQQAGQIVGPTLGVGQPLQSLQLQPQQEPAVVIQQRASGPDILVATSDGSSSERHHYEQQPLQDQLLNQDGPKPLAQLLDVAPTGQSIETNNYQGAQKPDRRNQQDEQPTGQSPMQPATTQQQDPAIIDHRPAPGQQDQQQQDYTQAPVTQLPPTLAPTTTQAPTLVSTQASPPQQQQLQTQQYQATQAPQQQSAATQAPPPAAGTSWYQPTSYAQQQSRSAGPIQQQPQQYNQPPQQQVGAPAVSQHPTSINAIISEQQQQPLISQQLPVQQQQTNSIAPIQGQASASQPSHQVVTVNGQPMILMNPNAASGGRRISLSGWLKGLSSMLANIFNRREHGILGQPQMAGSNPIGHWISLAGGSASQPSQSSPHWLSTSQSVAQQQQYQQQYQGHHNQQQQQQMMGSTRYTTYVQAPPQQAPSYQTQVQLQPQSQAPHQPQHQQVELQASASSSSFNTVAAPPLQTQPQQQPTTNTQGHHQAAQPVYQSQPQQMVQIGATAPASLSHSTLIAPAPIVAQPPRQSISPPQAQQQLQPQQPPPQPQQMMEPQQQQTNVITQSPQSQQVRATLAPVQQQGPRYGRSSATSSGLPLAHYSRYAGTQD